MSPDDVDSEVTLLRKRCHFRFLLRVLATISPREMHRLSREVVANAVATGRRQVEQADLAESDIDELTLNRWQIVANQVEGAESEQQTKTKLH